MEKICKNCKWWVARDIDREEYGGPIYQTSRGDCDSVHFVYNKDNVKEDDPHDFLYKDDCNNAAEIMPCAHFGCIHFKARS